MALPPRAPRLGRPSQLLAFHGAGRTRVYLHLHDLAHYYLGSKYFAEHGYGDLYTAMLSAEAKTWDNHFRSVEARDLRTNALVHIRALLEASDPVKARFAPQRWQDFGRDVAWFREELGPQWRGPPRPRLQCDAGLAPARREPGEPRPGRERGGDPRPLAPRLRAPRPSPR